MRGGVDAIGEVPRERFDLSALYDAQPATPGRVMSRFGGFLAGVEDFDTDFFHMSPREAASLDPQQRLLLEVAFEALEAGGQPLHRWHGRSVGVFVGMWLNEYEARMFRRNEDIEFYMTTGTGRYSASGRLSNQFGWTGPSMTVDCACSSSLVAIHLACQSLRLGESEMALAGGANVILEPSITIAYSQSRMMAPDGRCKFGDARADGYVRSDGAGVVVLKRLADAQAAGDPVDRGDPRQRGQQRRRQQRLVRHARPRRPGRHAAQGLQQCRRGSGRCLVRGGARHGYPRGRSG